MLAKDWEMGSGKGRRARRGKRGGNGEVEEEVEKKREVIWKGNRRQWEGKRREVGGKEKGGWKMRKGNQEKKVQGWPRGRETCTERDGKMGRANIRERLRKSRGSFLALA